MTRYVTLAEYFWLAEQVTGVDAAALAKASRSDLADAALHAPQAETAMLEIAAGEVDETWTAAWLKERVRFAPPRSWDFGGTPGGTRTPNLLIRSQFSGD